MDRKTGARDQMLQGMVVLLPERGQWSKAERDAWFDLLRQIIDYTVQVVPEAELVAEERR